MSECIPWAGSVNYKGYGVVAVGNTHRMAHRVVYEREVGPIPDGLTLDHLCRNRRCVNPDHLEPVTRGENVLRGQTLPAANAAKTECPKGHEYSPRADGTRYCRTCGAERNRGYYARNREAQVRRAVDYKRRRRLAALEQDR